MLIRDRNKQKSSNFILMTLFEQNYQAVVKRGLITPETTNLQFMRKVEEEFYEVEIEHLKESDNLYMELADLMNVCSNWLIYRGQDPEYWLTKVLQKNENRVKQLKTK